jgi:hypothetical protein
MSTGPHTFKLSDAKRLLKAAMQVTGLPADRLRMRYSPTGGIIVEPIGRDGDAGGKAEANPWLADLEGAK